MAISKILTASFCVGLAAGCSGGGGGDGGGRNGDGFKNTASPADFRAKAGEAKGIYESMGQVKGSFRGMDGVRGLTMLLQGGGFGTGGVRTCRLESQETDAQGTTTTVMHCDERANGRLVRHCDVTTVTNASGVQVSENEECEVVDGDDDDHDHDHDDDGDHDHDHDDDHDHDHDDHQGGRGNGMGTDLKAFLPSLDEVQDCASAFASFESLYEGAKDEFEELLTSLADAQNAQKSGMQGVSLRQGAADDGSAVSLELTPDEGVEGVQVKGRIAGGANDKSVRVVESFEMTIDFGAMLKGQMGQLPGLPQDAQMPEQPQLDLDAVMWSKNDVAIVADLEAKTAETTMSMAMKMTRDGQSEETVVNGSVLVSAGAEKFVTHRIAYTVKGQAEQTLATNVTARLVDENTLRVEGQMEGQVGGAKAPGALGYTVKRHADGRCEVVR